MAQYYDRYELLRDEDGVGRVPFSKIEKQSGDFYEIYEKGKTRMDQLSYKYYGDSNYGWLIMQANASLGTMEFDIPDKSEIRIPYPLASALDIYKNGIKTYKKLYE